MKTDVEGTVGDFVKAIQAKAGVEGVISDDEAEAVAGGFRVAFQPVELELTEWQGDRNN